MEEKAKQKFWMKLYNQGFLLEEIDDELILRPRGWRPTKLPGIIIEVLEVMPELRIKEVSPGQWAVISGAGTYSKYYRNKMHKEWFEGFLNGLATQAIQELL